MSAENKEGSKPRRLRLGWETAEIKGDVTTLDDSTVIARLREAEEG